MLEKGGGQNVTHVTLLKASSTNPGIATKNQFSPKIISIDHTNNWPCYWFPILHLVQYMGQYVPNFTLQTSHTSLWNRPIGVGQAEGLFLRWGSRFWPGGLLGYNLVLVWEDGTMVFIEKEIEYITINKTEIFQKYYSKFCLKVSLLAFIIPKPK